MFEFLLGVLVGAAIALIVQLVRAMAYDMAAYDEDEHLGGRPVMVDTAVLAGGLYLVAAQDAACCLDREHLTALHAFAFDRWSILDDLILRGDTSVGEEVCAVSREAFELLDTLVKGTDTPDTSGKLHACAEKLIDLSVAARVKGNNAAPVQHA